MPELQEQGGMDVAVESLRHGMHTSAESSTSVSSKPCISARVFDSCTLSVVGSVSSVLTCQQNERKSVMWCWRLSNTRQGGVGVEVELACAGRAALVWR